MLWLSRTTWNGMVSGGPARSSRPIIAWSILSLGSRPAREELGLLGLHGILYFALAGAWLEVGRCLYRVVNHC